MTYYFNPSQGYFQLSNVHFPIFLESYLQILKITFMQLHYKIYVTEIDLSVLAIPSTLVYYAGVSGTHQMHMTYRSLKTLHQST